MSELNENSVVEKRAAIAQTCNNVSLQKETIRVQLLFDQVFSIPLLLKEILEYLKFDDLLQASLVNKSWNFFAREILRDLNCVPKIEEYEACVRLKMLNDLLENAENVPFNGLSIYFPKHTDPERCDQSRLHKCVDYVHPSEIFCNVLSRITFKYFQTDFDGKSKCIATGIIRGILGDQEKAKELEELSFDAETLVEWCDLLGFRPKALSLPSLQIIEFAPAYNIQGYIQYDDDQAPCRSAQEILQAAPNLDQIDGFIHAHWLGCLSRLNIISYVQEFHYWPVALNNSCRTWVRELALSGPTLFRFCFSTQMTHIFFEANDVYPQLSPEYRDEVSQNVVRMLESSKDSLYKFDVDQLSLILLMSQMNVPVMTGVKNMDILFSPRTEECFQLPMLHKLDWSKYFPTLRSVTFVLWYFSKDIESDFYLHDQLRNAAEQFSCRTVTEFLLKGYEDDYVTLDSMDFSLLKVFSNIFPNVKAFGADKIKQFGEILENLWTSWEELERISVVVRQSLPIPNIDSVITGLSSDETIYLCENFEDLESLQVVPTRPCLATLSKLRFLGFQFHHPPPLCNEVHTAVESESPFLSRVSRCFSFARMPELKVAVRRDLCGEKCYFDLFSHLDSFVTLVSGQFEPEPGE